MASVVISGDTSGAITLSAPSVAGTNTITLPASTGTVLTTGSPQSGGVIQVVNATYSTQVDTTSTSLVTTGLTASIAPKFSTSKIVVLAFIPIGRVAGTTNNSGINFALYRNGTSIVSINEPILWTGGNLTFRNALSHQYYDSPATTSATTYTYYIAANASGDTVSSCQSSQQAQILLMEVAA